MHPAGTPLSLEDARRLEEGYVEHYNNVRLNNAIGYIAPKDMFAGRQREIHADRDRKLQAARQQRNYRINLSLGIALSLQVPVGNHVSGGGTARDPPVVLTCRPR